MAAMALSLCLGRLDVDVNPAPFALPEPQDAEAGAHQVAEHNRQPDVAGLERTDRLDDRAHPDRHENLRDDGNVQRTPRVAGALQTAGVTERDGDEKARHREVL